METDTAAAISSIKTLMSQSLSPTAPNSSPLSLVSHTIQPPLPQLKALKKAITEQVTELQKKGHIRGAALSLEEMLNPIKEDNIGETGFGFPGGDEEIVEMVTGVADGEDEDEGSEDDDNKPSVGEVTKPREALEICAQMERLCLIAIFKIVGTATTSPLFGLKTSNNCFSLISAQIP